LNECIIEGGHEIFLKTVCKEILPGISKMAYEISPKNDDEKTLENLLTKYLQVWADKYPFIDDKFSDFYTEFDNLSKNKPPKTQQNLSSSIKTISLTDSISHAQGTLNTITLFPSVDHDILTQVFDQITNAENDLTNAILQNESHPDISQARKLMTKIFGVRNLVEKALKGENEAWDEAINLAQEGEESSKLFTKSQISEQSKNPNKEGLHNEDEEINEDNFVDALGDPQAPILVAEPNLFEGAEQNKEMFMPEIKLSDQKQEKQAETGAQEVQNEKINMFDQNFDFETEKPAEKNEPFAQKIEPKPEISEQKPQEILIPSEKHEIPSEKPESESQQFKIIEENQKISEPNLEIKPSKPELDNFVEMPRFSNEQPQIFEHKISDSPFGEVPEKQEKIEENLKPEIRESTSEKISVGRESANKQYIPEFITKQHTKSELDIKISNQEQSGINKISGNSGELPEKQKEIIKLIRTPEPLYKSEEIIKDEKIKNKISPTKQITQENIPQQSLKKSLNVNSQNLSEAGRSNDTTLVFFLLFYAG